MPVSAHLQTVLDRIDSQMARDHRAAKRAYALDGAARYAADPVMRTRTLGRLRIADGDHRRIIAAVKERLALDQLLRRCRPYDPPAPIRRWTLLSVWIGERRLLHQTRTIARRFAPLTLAMAAE
jgi:hypothetical protein